MHLAWELWTSIFDKYLDSLLGATSLDKTNIAESTRGDDMDLPLFDLVDIEAATDNFSNENKLGEGGFGPVYKVNSATE